MSDRQLPAFVPAWASDAFVADAKRSGALVQTMMRNERQGHAEPTTSDAEWEALRAHRRRQFDEWQKLTQKLVQGGVLDTDEWGEHVLNEQRPTRWVHDETPDEYEQRMHALTDGAAVTFRVKSA